MGSTTTELTRPTRATTSRKACPDCGGCGVAWVDPTATTGADLTPDRWVPCQCAAPDAIMMRKIHAADLVRGSK
jgi:hypothetical protein